MGQNCLRSHWLLWTFLLASASRVRLCFLFRFGLVLGGYFVLLFFVFCFWGFLLLLFLFLFCQSGAGGNDHLIKANLGTRLLG